MHWKIGWIENILKIMTNKGITFYELMTAILIYCAIIHDTYWWYWAFVPIVYQGIANFAAQKQRERLLKKYEKEIDGIVKNGVPDHLKQKVGK